MNEEKRGEGDGWDRHRKRERERRVDIECRTTDETSTQGWVGYSLADPKKFGSCCGETTELCLQQTGLSKFDYRIRLDLRNFPQLWVSRVYTPHASTHSLGTHFTSFAESKVFGSSDTRDGRMMESPPTYP